MTDPSQAATAVERWFDMLNYRLDVTEVFTSDAVVIYFPTGRGGEGVRLEGHDEITAWARRPGEGRFVYEMNDSPRVVSPHGELPVAADGFAVRVGYRVSATALAWSNTGDDTLHVAADGRLCGVFHEPEPVGADADNG